MSKLYFGYFKNMHGQNSLYRENVPPSEKIFFTCCQSQKMATVTPTPIGFFL